MLTRSNITHIIDTYQACIVQKCKGENWVRGGVRDAKVLNAQLADILAKAKDTYKELDKEDEVTTVALAKEMTPRLSLLLS